MNGSLYKEGKGSGDQVSNAIWCSTIERDTVRLIKLEDCDPCYIFWRIVNERSTVRFQKNRK